MNRFAPVCKHGIWSLVAVGLCSLAIGQEPGGGEPHEKRGGWRSIQPSPLIPPVLVKAIREQKSGRYSGKIVREFNKGPQNLRHEEILFRDGLKTRIEFPPGSPYSGQVIVETSQDRRYYRPESNTIFVFPPRRDENFARLVGLARRAEENRISLAVAAGEKIAGIQTEQLLVRDNVNTVTQRLFIDPKSGVVLKRTVFDRAGTQIGYFLFTEVNLDPPPFPASIFVLSHPGAKLVTPSDTLREIASAEGFEPYFFPANSEFRLEGSRVMRVKKEKVLMESFSSRHGRLTLFELKNSVSPERLKEMAHSESQVFSWQRDGKWFVLIGPNTEQELAQLAQTLFTGTP